MGCVFTTKLRLSIGLAQHEKAKKNQCDKKKREELFQNENL
jgi:hypothetical protein